MSRCASAHGYSFVTCRDIALLRFVDCCEFSVYIFTVKTLTENSQQSTKRSEAIISGYMSLSIIETLSDVTLWRIELKWRIFDITFPLLYLSLSLFAAVHQPLHLPRELPLGARRAQPSRAPPSLQGSFHAKSRRNMSSRRPNPCFQQLTFGAFIVHELKWHCMHRRSAVARIWSASKYERKKENEITNGAVLWIGLIDQYIVYIQCSKDTPWRRSKVSKMSHSNHFFHSNHFLNE